MKKRDFDFGSINIEDKNMKIDIDLSRFEEQFQKAQYELDSMVMTDMLPFMPRVTGNFINLTKTRSASIAGSGEVVAAAPPYGRYLYYGKVMVNRKTGKGPLKIPNGPGEYILRFPEGSSLVETNRPLKYTNPATKPEWFEEAKKKQSKNWIKQVKKYAGGG